MVEMNHNNKAKRCETETLLLDYQNTLNTAFTVHFTAVINRLQQGWVFNVNPRQWTKWSIQCQAGAGQVGKAQIATNMAFYQHGALWININSPLVYSALSIGAQAVRYAQIASANSHYWWLTEDEFSAFPNLSSTHTSLSLFEGVRKGHVFQLFSLSWCHDFQLRTKKSFDRHFQFIHYFMQLSVHIKQDYISKIKLT